MHGERRGHRRSIVFGAGRGAEPLTSNPWYRMLFCLSQPLWVKVSFPYSHPFPFILPWGKKENKGLQEQVNPHLFAWKSKGRDRNDLKPFHYLKAESCVT